jgi:outer membrane protein
MMRGFLAAIAVSVLGMSAPALQAETLADALASAYKNSKLLDQNEALLRAADEDVAQAVARLRPVVNFVAQSQNTNTDPDVAGNDSLQSTLSLAAQWTVFDFGRGRLGVEIGWRGERSGVNKTHQRSHTSTSRSCCCSLESTR